MSDAGNDAISEPGEFVDSEGIGPLFNKSPRWFESNRARLMREGFPMPVSRNSWLRSAVIAFRDHRGRARIPQSDTMVDVSPPVDVAAAIRRTLARTDARKRGQESKT